MNDHDEFKTLTDASDVTDPLKADNESSQSSDATRDQIVQLAVTQRRLIAAQRALADSQSALAASNAASERLDVEHRRLLNSIYWRASFPIRWLVARMPPRLRRLLRTAVKAIWWCVTLQLGARLHERRKFLRAHSGDVGPSTSELSRRLVDGLDEDAAWYLLQNPDVAAAGQNAREHYRSRGKTEGRSWGAPSPEERVRQTGWYLQRHPEVVGRDAFQYFLRQGAQDGHAWPLVEPAADEVAADTLPWVRLLNVTLDPAKASCPALNVVLPSLAMKSMSGGPNTAIGLACRLAETGIKVRLVAVSAPIDADPTALWDHITRLTGIDARGHGVELVDGWRRSRPIAIGENDLFLATAWWTAQTVKYAVRHTRTTRFLYLIQDYESLLHAASTEQALAEETYSLDYLPIINSTVLRDFFAEREIGRFSDPAFARSALVFEPAVDPLLFYPQSGQTQTGERPKRLLFYARPSNGLRNLFELGVAALRLLVRDGTLNPSEWEIAGMGEAFEPVSLGSGCWLRPLPWRDLANYAEQMRDSDVLLSMMLSPHPSYPPLEMAACGRPVVTTVFGNKDAARLAAISPNIIGVEPTLEGVASGLSRAVRQTGTAAKLGLPQTWSESLSGLVLRLHDEVLRMQGAPEHRSALPDEAGNPDQIIFPGFGSWPIDSYGVYRQRMISDRANQYVDGDPRLLSFITTVWNTAPVFLLDLAETVFGQDSGPGFEWIILDNGSVDLETQHTLQRIAEHSAVRLFRVEENIGIIQGLRYVLERASHRYIVPLDSDDLLTPDCVRILTSSLRTANFPPLAYSDEDKVMAGVPRDPYSKPDWDPVLFTHSCYIAHVCAIDRQAALDLGCYTNRGAEGSSDWDSFTRFMLGGHTPLHVPELLYTWRMHSASTALDINSKGYIQDSQYSVLNLFLSGRDLAAKFTVKHSPLFNGTPDWRFVRSSERPKKITTVQFGVGLSSGSAIEPMFEGHQVLSLADGALPMLLSYAHAAAEEGRYIHLLSAAVRIDDASWADEALAMFDLYPTTALVGGRIHSAGVVVAADSYFGFGAGFGSPNMGRAMTDPGYFAQMWKPHSASGVPVEHCVLDSNFLAAVLPNMIRAGLKLETLSPWLGAEARKRQMRCIYSPFLSALAVGALAPASEVDVAAFCIANASIIPDNRLLSPRLSLDPSKAYSLVLRHEREQEERKVLAGPVMSYANRHLAELIARRVVAYPKDVDVADITLMTTVYNRTDPKLFLAAAESVQSQTVLCREWVVLAHGPISSELHNVLYDLSANKKARVLREDINLGIIGGMRVCLEAAQTRFVAPLDADDVLTVDAVELMWRGLTGHPGVDFAFSDEDILFEDKLTSVVRRTDFDQILNDADSTIWHFCCFDRTRALDLGVYSDEGAEACHDWDTTQRFSSAGSGMMHIPAVLYHWRHHPVSISNSGSTNLQSLTSVRHLLSRIMARQKNPDLYEIKAYPLSRGVEQLALLRKHSYPLPMCLMLIVRFGRAAAATDECFKELPRAENRVIQLEKDQIAPSPAALAAALDGLETEYIVLIDDALIPINEEGCWDAMRIFEMYPEVAAVGGRISAPNGVVLECGEPLAGSDVASAWRGRHRTDPGELALALKPQSAVSVADGYVYCRTSLLRAVSRGDESSAVVSLSDRIATAAQVNNLTLAYSPLVEAVRHTD